MVAAQLALGDHGGDFQAEPQVRCQSDPPRMSDALPVTQKYIGFLFKLFVCRSSGGTSRNERRPGI